MLKLKKALNNLSKKVDFDVDSVYPTAKKEMGNPTKATVGILRGNEVYTEDIKE